MHVSGNTQIVRGLGVEQGSWGCVGTLEPLARFGGCGKFARGREGGDCTGVAATRDEDWSDLGLDEKDGQVGIYLHH